MNGSQDSKVNPENNPTFLDMSNLNIKLVVKWLQKRHPFCSMTSGSQDTVRLTVEVSLAFSEGLTSPIVKQSNINLEETINRIQKSFVLRWTVFKIAKLTLKVNSSFFDILNVPYSVTCLTSTLNLLSNDFKNGIHFALQQAVLKIQWG